MSKSKEALALLDDLDSLAAPPTSGSSTRASTTKKKVSSKVPAQAAPNKDAADALAFIEQVTAQAAEPRKSMQAQAPTRVTLSGSRPSTPSQSKKGSTSEKKVVEPAPPTSPSATGAWGWGSVWNTASAALAQAKQIADDQVKNLPPMPPIPQKDQATKWMKYAQEQAQLANLGELAQNLRTTSISTLTGIMNVVAPPIAEHEVIQVTLSHDMTGYDGVESLVYRGLARILEQVEGGDLVVNSGKESRQKEGTTTTRNLNAVEGLDAALKLSEVDINEQIKAHSSLPKKEVNPSNPTTYTPIFIRIQPFTSPFPDLPVTPTNPPTDATTKTNLQFLIYLSDPEHKVTHASVSQAVPASWMELWDLDEKSKKKNGEWIEDMLVDALRGVVENVGQEYVVSRMHWDAALEEESEEEDDDDEEEESEEEESEDETEPSNLKK